MKAIRRARIWCYEHDADFLQLLDHCMEHGVVAIERDLVLLAEEREDSWVILLLVGDMRYAMLSAPRFKPFVEFERERPDGRMEWRRVRWEVLERLVPGELTTGLGS